MADEEMGMPAKRELSMRQLRHLPRLHHGGVSAREIGRRLGVARSTVQDNLKRAAAGLAWPLADDVTDDALEQRLFGRAGNETGQRRRIEPDLAALARELKRPGVTMMILWEEYRKINQEGYGYSRFCDLLRGFERRPSPVMRQHHVAGKKAFVDYSGKRIAIVDPSTGEIHEAEIFVGVLAASNLTYAEATWTQQLADWTGAHVRMFRFFGGVPKLLVPDNLKSGVSKASFYDPEINRTYGAMAAHYSVGILPARPYKATRQDEGRSRRQICSDLHPRAIARADLPLARRMQPRHHDCHAAHERAHHAPSRPEPARTVREGRARRAQRFAGRGLGVRGMGARASQPRLSHRGP
jgi:transposase